MARSLHFIPFENPLRWAFQMRKGVFSMSRETCKAVVLAAGKGTRLHSEAGGLPKVMRQAAGKPLIRWVLGNLDFIPAGDTVLVVGFMKERVMEACPGYVFAEQKEQKGTGHAVLCAADALAGYDGPVLVCCGDMPLMKKSSYLSLLEEHRKSGNDCTVLSGSAAQPLPYGRIVRNADGSFCRIVEEKDCTAGEKAITELNAGVYVFETDRLWPALDEIGCENAQGEYYLTDVPRIILENGGIVGISKSCGSGEMLGVNTPQELELAEKLLKEKFN